MFTRILCLGLVFYSALSFATEHPCWHYLLEAQERIAIAEDRVGEERTRKEMLEATLAGYLSAENALPGKNITQAKYQVADAKIAIEEAEKDLEVARVEGRIWQARTEGTSVESLEQEYRQLWEARAVVLDIQARRADALFEFEKANHARLEGLGNSGAISRRDIRDAYYRMKAAEGQGDSLRRRAQAIRNAPALS